MRVRSTGKGAALASAAAGAIAIVASVVVVVRTCDPERGSPRPAVDPEGAAGRPAAAVAPGTPSSAPARPAAVATMPAMPSLTQADRAAMARSLAGEPRPGARAFRALSDRYVDENLASAERQAAAEGLTLAEVRELTYFGLLVLTTQRTAEVEQLTGRPLSQAAQEQLGQLMRSSNSEFQAAMRALVSRRAAEPERWELIRSAQARYEAELFRITGLDAELLDDLLAGEVGRPSGAEDGTSTSGPRPGAAHDDTIPGPPSVR
jgi:hypothetical protein